MERTYGSEIEIAAPAQVVWEILTDLPAYGSWNPFTPRVRATALEPGRWILIEARMGRLPFVVVDRIVQRGPDLSIAWALDVGPLLRGRRVQVVEPLGADRCRYRTSETFSGALVPVLHRAVGATLDAGMARMAAALRSRSEAA